MATTSDFVTKANNTLSSSPSQGWAKMSLCLAQVIRVHWEDLRCDIKILQGEKNEPIYDGCEILMPAIGARHFLGAIPEIGDMCVVGWFVANSDSNANTRSPAIINWFPRASFYGHDWLPTQSYSVDELQLNTPKDRKELEGVANRIRHKLRHLEPGNIGASSSQGSDLVLDESVFLSNRRANEIRLRDQDQALVVRTLQQFHAMGGARIYGGIVQRDARILPKEMISDGLYWEQSDQLSANGLPISDFLPDPTPQDGLKPHPVFRKKTLSGEMAFETDTGGELPDLLDPYKIAYQAGLINQDLYDESEGNSQVYGGKGLLRLDPQGTPTTTKNFATEYRIELNHVTDGTLPVNEQTDGFDVDRLPTLRDGIDKLPFIEWVLGSVVGNDAFSETGKILYGKPLVLDMKTNSLKDAKGFEFTEHCATLLKVQPVIGRGSPSIMSFTKGGGFKAVISSNAQINILNSLELNSNSINLTSNNDLALKTNTANMIFNELNLQVNNNSAVNISTNKTLNLNSKEAIVFNAPSVRLGNSGQINLNSQSAIVLGSGEAVNISSKGKNETITGSSNTTISGPKDFNMLSGPPRSTKILATPATGQLGGVVDEKVVAFGDELNTYLTTSNVTNLIASGSHNTIVTAGAITKTVGSSSFAMSPANISLTVPSGVVSISASTSISMLAGADATLSSEGATKIRGGASIILAGGKAPSVGWVLCGSDRDTLTGLPYTALGLLPRGVAITPG
jgi:hypothetical protein